MFQPCFIQPNMINAPWLDKPTSITESELSDLEKNYDNMLNAIRVDTFGGILPPQIPQNIQFPNNQNSNSYCHQNPINVSNISVFNDDDDDIDNDNKQQSIAITNDNLLSNLEFNHNSNVISSQEPFMSAEINLSAQRVRRQLNIEQSPSLSPIVNYQQSLHVDNNNNNNNNGISGIGFNNYNNPNTNNSASTFTVPSMSNSMASMLMNMNPNNSTIGNIYGVPDSVTSSMVIDPNIQINRNQRLSNNNNRDNSNPPAVRRAGRRNRVAPRAPNRNRTRNRNFFLNDNDNNELPDLSDLPFMHDMDYSVAGPSLDLSTTPVNVNVSNIDPSQSRSHSMSLDSSTTQRRSNNRRGASVDLTRNINTGNTGNTGNNV